MSRTFFLVVLLYALALVLSIKGSSLWADEAFSAWLASHDSLRSFGWSLFHGDSSDLQMGLYYLYLFGWVKVFGFSEYALRSANIPFIFLFSFALMAVSWIVFRTRTAWVAAALLPFVWHYAGEARPYMAILALATAACGCVLAFVRPGRVADTRLPWICLSCILAGACFHMLFLLVVPPLALIGYLGSRGNGDTRPWQLWILPLKSFALPFLTLAAFLAFTFLRGTAYDYPRPGVRQMASVFYELSGLEGFGPNRKFSLDFHPFLPWLVPATVCLIAALFCVFNSVRRTRSGTRQPDTGVDTGMITLVLGSALGLALAEILVLSFAIGKQVDVRHLAAIVPLIIFMLIAVSAGRSASSIGATVLLSLVWITADIRTAVIQQYQKEDYRDAVAAALRIQQRTGASVVLVSDPVGAAYYGMNVEGAAPCYPIRQACRDAFAKVTWGHTGLGIAAERWPESRIGGWLAVQRQEGKPVLVFAQLDRAHQASAWWPEIRQSAVAAVTPVHGFDLDLLKERALVSGPARAEP
jgi:hypothetical protein